MLSPSKLGEEKDICPQPRGLKSVSLTISVLQKNAKRFKKKTETQYNLNEPVAPHAPVLGGG